MAREHAALQAGVQYCRDQIKALQRLADVQSDAMVNPTTTILLEL